MYTQSWSRLGGVVALVAFGTVGVGMGAWGTAQRSEPPRGSVAAVAAGGFYLAYLDTSDPICNVSPEYGQ